MENLQAEKMSSEQNVCPLKMLPTKKKGRLVPLRPLNCGFQLVVGAHPMLVSAMRVP
jgi:hypothetical protein